MDSYSISAKSAVYQRNRMLLVQITEPVVTVVYYLAFHSIVMDFSAQNGCNCVQVFS